MINRLLITSLTLGSLSSCYASDITVYLQEKAQEFVYSQLDIPLEARAEVIAAPLDERLPLTRCENLLTLSLPAKMEIRRNTTIYLKCEEEKPWDLYIPVRVSIHKPYATVTTPIAKGDQFTESQLTIAYHDQTLARGDHLTDPAVLVGARSKRELKPGQPIRLSQVCVVCKGDQVTLTAESKNFQIKTIARALQDGGFGEIIKLINIRSGKTVEGKVSAVGVVTVIF